MNRIRQPVGTCKYEQKACLIVSQGEAANLPAGSRIAQVDVLIAPRIAARHEYGYVITQIPFNARMVLEQCRAHGRVQSICSDHEIEGTPTSVLEAYVYTVGRLLNGL